MTDENWTYGKVPADNPETLDLREHLQKAVDDSRDQINRARESVFEERLREIIREEIDAALEKQADLVRRGRAGHGIAW